MANENNLEELERQLERSGFFTHTSLSNQANRLNEIESFLYALIDTLIQKKVIEKDTFEKNVKKVREETLQRKEHFHAGVAVRQDKKKGSAKNYVPVNCEERLPICKGVCCKLNYALSVKEIESGKIKWDLGQPYFIRQGKNGYCSHLDSEKKCCSIYDDRPKVCRKYSCANDPRIWKDFDRMDLNKEWIDANLGERKIQLQEIYMMPDENIEYKSKRKA